MPNALAYLMLLIWPLIAAGLFLRLSVERAVIWSILGAYLVLPPIANFDFPLVPPLDKVSIPNLLAYLCPVVLLGLRVGFLPASPVARVLMAMFVLCPIPTMMTNTDPIFYAVGGLPGLAVNDAISTLISQVITLLPFVLARRFLATEAAQQEIARALLIAGLAYSIPMLIEIRMSPQINVWVYGFFQHDFIQMMRQGGYRPIVFLPHGLWVAFFAFMATIAAIALWRHGPAARRGAYLIGAGYLWLMLFLCKSAAALIYSVALGPVVALAGARLQIRIAVALALVALLFPFLRGADLVPAKAMVAMASSFSEDRADSLAFRFGNEDKLLTLARQRPWFGWGGWGRSRVHDPVTGEDISTTDGRWIILIGAYGWFGYVAEFGLLAWPILLVARRAGRRGIAEISPWLGPLVLILGANMIDMLPNATLIPFTWLLAGAILGHAEALARGPVPAGPDPAGPAAAATEPRRRTIL